MKGSEEFTYEFPEMSPRERLRELILYIAEKLKDDPKFGRTKLETRESNLLFRF